MQKKWVLFFCFFVWCYADEVIRAIRVKKIHVGDGTVISGGVLLIQGGKFVEVGQIAIPPRTEILVDSPYLELTPGLINTSVPSFLEASELQDAGQSASNASEGFDPYQKRWKSHFEASRLQIGEHLKDGLRYREHPSFQQELWQSGVTTYVLASGSSRWIEGMSSTLRLKKENTVEWLVENHILLIKTSTDLSEATKQVEIFEMLLQESVDYEERKGDATQAQEDYEKAVKVWKEEKAVAEKDKKEFKKEEPKRPALFQEDEVFETLMLLRKRKKTLSVEAEVPSTLLLWSQLAKKFQLSVLWRRGHIDAFSVFSEKKEPVVMFGEQLEDGKRFAVALSRNSIPVLFGTTTFEESRSLRFLACHWIRQGLSPEAALQGLTSSAAKVLGLQDRIGLIKKGLEADLVLYDGDPMNSLSQVILVLVQGEIVYDAR